MRWSTPYDLGNRIVVSLSRMTLQSTDDSRLLQHAKLRGFHSEVMDTIEHAHPYGFTARPKAPDQSGAAEAFVNFLGANRTHGVAMVTTDRRYRPNNLQEGESLLFDDQGLQVYLSRGRLVIHAPAGMDVHLQTGDGSHVLATNGKVKMQNGTSSVTCKGGCTYLGSESASHAVVTVDGPSSNVFATIGESDSAMAASPIAKRTKKSG